MRACGLEGCDRAHFAHDLCNTHYARLRRTGTTDPPEKVLRTCEMEGCDRPHKAQGLCHPHYQKWLKFGDAERTFRRKPCGIPGCKNLADRRGWCENHFARYRKSGDPIGIGPLRTDTPRGREVAQRRRKANDLLRQAMALHAHGRRRDVADLVGMARDLGPLWSGQEAVAKALLIPSNRERDNMQLQDDVIRLSAKGMSAEQVGARLGVSDRTVTRYRTEAKKLRSTP